MGRVKKKMWARGRWRSREKKCSHHRHCWRAIIVERRSYKTRLTHILDVFSLPHHTSPHTVAISLSIFEKKRKKVFKSTG